MSNALHTLLEHSPDLAIVRQGVAAARAGLLSADTRPNPTLSVSSGSISPRYGLGAGSLRDKRMDTVIGLDQTLERGGKRELRIRSASRGLEASNADVEVGTRQLLAAFYAAYFDLLAAQEGELVSLDNAALARRGLLAAETRLKAGDLAAADVARVRTDALRAANDASQSQLERRRRQLALASLLGLDAKADSLCVAADWPAPQTLSARAESETLLAGLEARAPLRAAQARLDAALAERDLARSLRRRDVTVGIRLEHYPFEAGGTGNTYGIALSMPLLLGNEYQGDIARAEAGYTAALAALQRARASTGAELLRLAAEVDVARERYVRARDELLPAARRSAAAAEFAFGKGALGVTDMLDARRTLRAVELESLETRSAYAQALHTWQLAREQGAPVLSPAPNVERLQWKTP